MDDIIIAASNMKLINETKGLLSGRFKMVDIGPLSWFLGIDFKIEKIVYFNVPIYFLK